MMGEIVDHHDTARLADHFLTPLHAAKLGERLTDVVERHAVPFDDRGDGGDRVRDVVSPTERHDEPPARNPARVEIECRPGGVGDRRRSEPARRRAMGLLALERVPRDVRAGRAPHDPHDGFVRRVRHDEPRFRDALDETAEGVFVAWSRRVDVHVVVFDGGDDRDLGAVVEKFRRLLEERRVVFVPLDDER